MVAAVCIRQLLVEGRRNPFVAPEGIPFLALIAAAFVVALRYLDAVFAVSAALLWVALFLLFRDPRRQIPSAPLGVVSPVDGEIVAVDHVDEGVLQGRAHRIRIEIDSFGTYTARSPVEGKIMSLHSIGKDKVIDYETNAMWVQTDEGDDIVLQFTGYRLGLAPRAIVQFGDRVGQGKRCAYLRLARYAEVHLPISSTVLVKPGQVVVAGSDVIAKLLHS
jgi:phosphatidylserine decarboxylase